MEFLKLLILIAQLIYAVCGKVVIIPDTSKLNLVVNDGQNMKVLVVCCAF